jgi:hypothetical protein
LAEWAAENRDLFAPSGDGGADPLVYPFIELARHREQAARWSRQLMQTATHLDPTTAYAQYSAGLYRLQQWETLPAEERQRVVQQLRGAIQLDPKYAASILQVLWERTQDRDLVRALARGTPEEARWRIDGRNAPVTR